jgi:hypothetical protein
VSPTRGSQGDGAREEHRYHPGPEDEAEEKTAEREDAGDEAAPEPGERGQRDQRDGHQVEE